MVIIERGGNTTQVDMFGFPMTARLQQTAIGYDQTVGITRTRDQVITLATRDRPNRTMP
ncbi:hypothetical protein LZC95_27885 [Pendulispora brunnea]|uniref:Uncharacterized protein n=1 Tax=Pendulispora brunnea TaxID=2905690 RepID=A0ABZ2JUY4_9BACT